MLLAKFTKDQKYLTSFFHQPFQILRKRRNGLVTGINNIYFFLPAYFFKHLCSLLWSLHGNWFHSALNNKVNNLWSFKMTKLKQQWLTQGLKCRPVNGQHPLRGRGIREGGSNRGQYCLVKSLDFQASSQVISPFQESLKCECYPTCYLLSNINYWLNCS